MSGIWRCPTCRLDVPDGEPRCPRDGAPRILEPGQLGDPLIGAQLGEYRLLERIGSGGMGFVYRGVQPLIGKQVAVKILRPEIAEDPEQMQRLLAEARAVTAIRHRGIIDVFGFGQLPDGRQYLVMEFLEGVTLEHLVETGRRLPVADVVSVLDEILSALAAAHAAGIVHRDLKPSNLFLAAQSDGTSVVKVLDFGLAKHGAPGKSAPQSRLSLMVGTPEYMAPEQARGEPVGPTADLYALGVVAYQLLAGALPFTGATPIEVVLQHLEKAPPPMSRSAASVPVGLQALVLSLLAKAPRDRPQRADDVRHSLRQLALPGVTLPPVSPSGATSLRPQLGHASLAARASQEVRATPSGLAKTFLRRRPRLATASLAALLLLIAAAAIVWDVVPHGSPYDSPARTPPSGPPGARTAARVGAAGVAFGEGASPAPSEAPSAGSPGRTSGPREAPVQSTPSARPPGEELAGAPAHRRPASATSSDRSTASRSERTSSSGAPPGPEATHPHTRSADRSSVSNAAPTRAELTARIEQMTARVRAQAGTSDPDPLALALLQKARSDAQRAREPIDRERIGHRLDVIEAKFLSGAVGPH